MRSPLRLRALATALVVPFSAACSALGDHARLEPWSKGFDAFTSAPAHWVPAAACTVATPLILIDDAGTSSESVEDQFFNSNTKYGDELAIGLGAAPVLWGAFDGLAEGDTAFLEISSEALLLTMATSYTLKSVIHRERPDNSSSDSFPSAHTSFSFVGATLLARRWEEEHDGSWLGYLLYLPASYVGVSRTEGARHYLSDVTFGAALGIFWAHLVYDAHTVEGGLAPRTEPRAVWRTGPVFDERGAGVGVSLSF